MNVIAVVFVVAAVYSCLEVLPASRGAESASGWPDQEIYRCSALCPIDSQHAGNYND